MGDRKSCDIRSLPHLRHLQRCATQEAEKMQLNSQEAFTQQSGQSPVKREHFKTFRKISDNEENCHMCTLVVATLLGTSRQARKLSGKLKKITIQNIILSILWYISTVCSDIFFFSFFGAFASSVLTMGCQLS